jgi:hypothetical protein
VKLAELTGVGYYQIPFLKGAIAVQISVQFVHPIGRCPIWHPGFRLQFLEGEK